MDSFPDVSRKAFLAHIEGTNGSGWERYYDLSPDQRRAAMPNIMRELETGDIDSKKFARGFLDALRTAREEVKAL
jgi:hypothetical protein